jgi:1,4-dihydroxy-2-naphthoyl-CoA hydrolase
MNIPYVHYRIVRFQETDAAGVVYFANVLNFCHEAYEASLQAAGINLRQFFQGAVVAVPIVEAQVTFAEPFYCGDRLRIELLAIQCSPEMFEMTYQLWREPDLDAGEVSVADSPGRPAARAHSRHVCIDAQDRRRCPLPLELLAWLNSEALGDVP